MFENAIPARRFRAVLAVASAIAPLSFAAPAWQYTHTGGSVTELTTHNSEFVALRADGALLFSGDARTWEKRVSVEPGARMHAKGGAYLFFSFTGELYDDPRTAVIRRTTDFESFETVFETKVASRTDWIHTLVETPGGPAALLTGPDHTEILLTADGTEWTSVHKMSGPRIGGAWTTPSGTTALTLFGTNPVQWLESDNSVTWVHHNAFIGHYVALAGIYIGVGNRWATERVFVSKDAEDWIPADVNFPPGPASIAAGNGRAVIQTRGRETFMTLDGEVWTAAQLPEPAHAPPHQVTFGFHEGRFWLSRKAVPPPDEIQTGSGLGDAEVFSSVDAIVWSPEDVLPPDFADESGTIYVTETPLPENSTAVSLSRAPEPADVAHGLTTVRLAPDPDDNRHALFHTVADGPEMRVNTNWGSIPTEHAHEPFKLVAANGVFLVRNVHGRLGFFEDGADYLPQPVARFDGPESEFAVRLWWEPVEGADRYRIHRETETSGDDAVPPLVTVGETTATVWLDHDDALGKEENYRYTVTAHADDGRESFPGHRVDTRLFSVWNLADGPGIDPPAGQWFPVSYIGHANAVYKPWTRTLGARWWYIHEVRRGFWAWDPAAEQWLWSALDAYPWVYDPEAREWIAPATDE
ncbi:MAG: hypothetical protein JJU00_13660 [Opitutales bacterium]|nr:hypothetical protein [Opitutales bacterium]